MVTVLIEDTIVMNGREITSNPKMYEVADEETAIRFIENLYNIDQGENTGNLIRARILDYSVKPTTEAVPMILHTVHYDHSTTPQDGLRYLEHTDVLTVEEIEDFRARGIKSGVVFAYDNPDSIEPSISDGLPEQSSRFDTVGTNLFAHDEDTTFHLSFNPKIGDILREKYGHTEEADNDNI